MSLGRPVTNVTPTTDVDMESTEVNAPEPLTVKRLIHINISNSLSNFGMEGPCAAQWKPVEGKLIEVLGPSEHNACHVNAHATLNSLSTAVIKKATILEQQSNFPIPLGVTVSCLPSEECTDDGEKYLCTVLPNMKSNYPQVVFEADTNSVESLKWSQSYPGFNGNNLESHEVMDVLNAPYVFVRDKHPVISLLRANKDLLGSDIDEQPRIDDEWYKVQKNVFATCCSTLRKKILPKLNTKDLTKFSVQLHRMNGDEWGDFHGCEETLINLPYNMNGEAWNADKHKIAVKQAMERMSKQTYSYFARLELIYEIQP